jgi:arylsulfatase A-like enzyme
VSLFTGLWARTHGIVGYLQELRPEVPTLPEALRAGGFLTAAFTEDGYIVPKVGFQRGFDVYRENRSEESASPGFAVETFGDASAWLSAHADRPFFLFVHTYQVHDPYTPPRGYAGLFPDVNPNDKNDAARADYEREIRYTDDLFAGFLDTLDALAVAEQTLVVVTSDHGEGFGEHFWTGHAFDLHDEALLVPLLLRAPGLIPAGRVVEEQVGLVDLTPTLLDLLEVSPPPEVMGRSFASLLTSRGAKYEERPLAGTAVTESRSIRTRQYKLVTTKMGDLFYDLVKDPLERTSRLAEEPERVAAAREALKATDEACTRWTTEHPAEAAADAAGGNAPAWMINRDEIDRKLRSLGYVQ